MGEVSPDDIRTNQMCDLISLYQDTENVITDNDYPFQYSPQTCNYYDPNELKLVIDTNSLHENVTSYFHLNYRGLSSNWDLPPTFQSLLCDLHGDKFNFDILGLSEIFRTTCDIRLILPGYHELVSRCRDDGPRGGVDLFIRKNINDKIREDISSFVPHIFESLFIEISYSGTKNVIIGIMY